MREIRQSGSEGGGNEQTVSPYPYLGYSFPEVPLRHPEGMQTFSRWLSVAIPPENKHLP